MNGEKNSTSQKIARANSAVCMGAPKKKRSEEKIIKKESKEKEIRLGGGEEGRPRGSQGSFVKKKGEMGHRVC